MRRTILIPTRFSGPWARAGAIVLAGGIFASAANIVGPERSAATTVTTDSFLSDNPPIATDVAAARAAKLPAFLGSLTSANYRIDVYVGRNAPLYTIMDLDGNILAERIRSDEVYARFPELSLGDMHAEAGTAPDITPDR